MSKDLGLQLAAVRIFATNLEKAKEFYSTSLGLKFLHGSTQQCYLVYQLNDASVLIIECPDSDDPKGLALVGRFTGVSFEVKDVQQAYKELKDRGVKFVGPPQKQEWGGTLTNFFDLENNELTIVQSQSKPSKDVPTKQTKATAHAEPVAYASPSVEKAWSMIFEMEEKIAEIESRAASIPHVDEEAATEAAINKQQMAAKVEAELAALKNKTKKTRLVIAEEKKQLPAIRTTKTKNLPKRLND